MRKIALTQGKFALVDEIDFDYLNQWKWFFDGHYPARNKPDRTGLILMHRLVNNTPAGFLTDHINRNKLDNRRSNLRTVDKSQNEHNVGPRRNNSFGVKGVYLDKRRNSWSAQIMIRGRRYFYGPFDSLQEARVMHDKMERKLCQITI